MKIKNLKIKNSGFTLLLSVLITSIILGIAIGFPVFVIKELQISAIGRESQKAFFAADSGVECALYWDTKHNAFTPSIGGNDSNTVSLLHMNEDFSDSAVGGTHIWTIHGDADISGSQKKFGEGSGRFDGNGDYISPAPSSDFSFGSGDFTIDFWVRLDSVGSSQPVYDGLASGSTGQYFYFDSATGWTFKERRPGSTYTTIVSQGSTSGTIRDIWYHIALVRNGSTWKIYRNGISIASNTNSLTLYNSGPVNVGYYADSPTYLDGYLDEFRVSKGISRWTSDFTPPETEYSAGGGTTISCAGSNPVVGLSSVSEFELNFTNGACVHIKVDKSVYPQTKIDSYGRNTCDTSDPNRVERALEIIY